MKPGERKASQANQLFTVLMMLPDYIASNYGQETYLAWVAAPNAKKAEKVAQVEAQDVLANGGQDAEPDDFFVVFVAHGHIDDVSTGD